MAVYHIPGATLDTLQLVSVSRDGLVVGPGSRRRWGDLTAARFGRGWARNTSFILELDLTFGTQSEKITMNGSTHDIPAFAAMLRDICGHIETSHPGMQVSVGHSRLGRWLIFLVGLMLLAASALIMALAFDAGFDMGDIGKFPLLLIGIGAGALSLCLVLPNLPFIPLPRVAPARLMRRAGLEAA